MTDKTTELIESYKGWDSKEIKRYPLDAARVIADLLSTLEAEHLANVTNAREADDALSRLEAAEAERDALRAALLEMADAARNCPSSKTVDEILSRAIDTKEEKP